MERFAASRQSLFKYHFVAPIKLPMREILWKSLLN
jgi:hypothetical protein